MSTNNPEIIDQALLDKIRVANEDFHVRTTNQNEEVVKYADDSSVRIWYNKENVGYSLHWHTAMELILVIEESYVLKTQTTEYLLSPGDLLLIPSGELHEIVTPDKGTRIICLIDNSIISQLSGYSAIAPFFSQPIYIKRDETDSLYNRLVGFMKQIIREYADRNPFYELVISARLISLFVTIGRHRLLGDKTPSAFPDLRQNELSQKLSIAFDFIDTHYTEDVSLEDVASIAGFSKFHFSRLFKQCSGQNFHEYLCYKRVQASEALLLKPNYSITEIAFKSGFSSLSTFNRAFKNINHCSPTEYRNLNQFAMD